MKISSMLLLVKDVFVQSQECGSMTNYYYGANLILGLWYQFKLIKSN